MPKYRPALSALALTSLLLATGCTTDEGDAAPDASTAPAGMAAHPRRQAGAARLDLVAALEKTSKAAFTMTVDAELPDKGSIKATGGYDKGKKRLGLDSTVKGASARKLQLVVVGNDSWTRLSDGDTWVHLDQDRLRKNALQKIDMTDPTGLDRFTKAVKSVKKTGDTTYSGTFDASEGTYSDPIIPVGAPAFYGFGRALASTPFTATTDAKGWVTSIVITVKTSPELTMTTKLAGHGRDAGVKKPGRYAEAADFYYN